MSAPPNAHECFTALFQQATGNSTPLPYQERLALCNPFPALLDVPTGLGKTAAAILAWIWRRRFAEPSTVRDTPRRLVYCLPMRVLVEQTYTEALKWLQRLGMLAGTADWTEVGADGLPTRQARVQRAENGVGRGYNADPGCDHLDGWASTNGDHGKHPIAVHLLLGGEEKTDWALWPERDAILIGTQDMLLSRAMNRGYAAGRARWPLEFGFLNSDCLWVFDEIQIMDTGLASSLQFDAWRRSLQLRPARDQFPEEKQNHLARRCSSLWMSATMAKHWLERAVDWSPRVETEWSSRYQLVDTERTNLTLRSGQLFQITKTIHQPPIAALEKPKTKDGRADKVDADRKQAEYLKRLAEHIGKTDIHAQSGLTLVIVNTVDRAKKLYELLKKQVGLAQVPIKLIHSRFRPLEREQWSAFLGQKDSTRRILISTQVVEAGVDLSACLLYTELAPWASLVQRFGRCARYPGESGNIVWLDLDLGKDSQPVDHWARPYDRAELVAAREKLKTLSDGGLQSLTKIKAEIDGEPSGEQATTLFPYEPRFIPHDKDLFDLFDTTPDLTGADVDVSRFIRDGEELDVQVFWREVPSDSTPLKRDRPHRRELCTVPFHRFRELLSVLRKAGRIWRRNYRKGWEEIDARDSEQVYPGQIFLLERSCGGYDRNLGWTGVPTDRDFDLPAPIELAKATAQDEEEDADDLSQINEWLTIKEHTRKVCQKLDELLASSGASESEIKVLRLAARLHDWGKAHAAFVAKLDTEQLSDPQVVSILAGQPAAKAPDSAWKKNGTRPGFRHELASALAILVALHRAIPEHPSFAWPDGLDKTSFGNVPNGTPSSDLAEDPLMRELGDLSADELDLLVYLVAAHHGKVRMSLRSSSDDARDNVPDPCPNDKRQARGVRDDDRLPRCLIPASDLAKTNETPVGAVLFAGATTKRLSQYGKGKAAFPFMIDHLASDEASTSTKDEAKQDAQIMRCRAEFWMPLWSQPTSLPGIRALLAEGKLQRVSGERTEHTLHAMEAIKTLGVTRGVDTFHRVALFERRGKGYYLASSLGYHSTAQAPDSLAPQLAEIEEFRQRVYSKLREGPGIPDRVMSARRSLHTALAALLTRDEHRSISVGETLVDVLTRVAGVEREVSLLKDREQLLNPCPHLSRAWVPDDANDADLRLARAIASIPAWGESSDPYRPAVDAIRSNLLPVRRRGRAWQWDETSRSAVWSRGASLTGNLSAVLRRRLIDAQRGKGDGLPLWSPHGATYADLLAYWNGDIDETRIAELIHGFALIDSGQWNQVDINDWQQQRQERCETPDIDTSQIYFVDEIPRGKLRVPRWLETDFDSACELPRVYHLLKLCFLGGRLPRRPVERESARRTGAEPFPPDCLDVLSLLEAERLADAVQLAARRLRAKGYPSVLRDVDLASLLPTLDCRRLAGMMLIPVRHPGVSAALAIKPESTNS